jgi:uronate dehydrogenase
MVFTVTGSTGTIGTALVEALATEGIAVRTLDTRSPGTRLTGVDFIQTDLRDLDATTAVTRGSSVIVHLAGISTEAPFSQIAEHNITSTYNVLEAARRNSIHRVVLASSNHTIGFTPVGQTVTAATPNNPDTFYGVSKVAGEALGSLYANKFGVSVVAIRIGSFLDKPTEPRHTATWLSKRDGLTLLRAAATAELTKPFLIVYGTSNNPMRWWPRDGWDQLDYQPLDSAARQGTILDQWHGGSYASTIGFPR